MSWQQQKSLSVAYDFFRTIKLINQMRAPQMVADSICPEALRPTDCALQSINEARY